MNIRSVKLTEKLRLKNIYQFYLYELSQYTGDKLNSLGTFSENTVDFFMNEDELHPFFIELNNAIIGFIFIQTGSWNPDKTTDYYISEFFIMNGYKNQGYGTKAAEILFDKYPGRYLIGQIFHNKAAVNFWHNLYNKLYIDYSSNQMLISEDDFDFLLQKVNV